MSEMKTLKFPGDTEPREIVDAKAREDISKLSEDMLTEAELSNAVDNALAQAKESGEFDGPQGETGPQGPAGADGAPGPVGATPNIQIGMVETLAAGSPATASMGGTPENPILNLGIPQGAPGSGGNVDQSGLSAEASALLITILRNGVYSTDQSSNITALAAALGGAEEEPDEPDVPEIVNYTITNVLTNASNSSPVSSVVENNAYTATITANDGYTLSSVVVTMGGIDVTDSVYANGYINIPAVTGDVVITAVATGAVSWSKGYINNDGVLTELENNYVSNLYDEVDGVIEITVPDTFADLVSQSRIAEYDADKNFVKRGYTTPANATYTLDLKTRYVRMGFNCPKMDVALADTLFSSYSLYVYNFLIGYFNGAESINKAASYRQGKEYKEASGTVTISVGSDYVSKVNGFRVVQYDSDKNYIKYSAFDSVTTGSVSANLESNCAYVRVSVGVTGTDYATDEEIIKSVTVE